MRLSGNCPTCQLPIPAESIIYRSAQPRSSTRCCITACAAGERQILPKQIKRIFILLLSFNWLSIYVSSLVYITVYLFYAKILFQDYLTIKILIWCFIYYSIIFLTVNTIKHCCHILTNFFLRMRFWTAIFIPYRSLYSRNDFIPIRIH